MFCVSIDGALYVFLWVVECSTATLPVVICAVKCKRALVTEMASSTCCCFGAVYDVIAQIISILDVTTGISFISFQLTQSAYLGYKQTSLYALASFKQIEWYSLVFH